MQRWIIDTVIRNSIIGDKLITHYQKFEKLSRKAAIKKLEDISPLAKNPKTRTVYAPASQWSLSNS